MIYEAWRITYQSSEAAARAAYNTVEKLHEENQALRKYVDGLQGALGAQARFSVEEFEKQGMRLVNAGSFDAGNPTSGAQDKMSTTQQTDAQRLADKYEAHGFLGDRRFAQEHWCRQAATELRRLDAENQDLRARVQELGEMARENRSKKVIELEGRIAELEAQLSAIGAGDQQEIASLQERLGASQKSNTDWAARTHAVEAANAKLRAEIDDLTEQMAAIGAGGVEPLRKRGAAQVVPVVTSAEQSRAEFEAWACDRYPSIDLTRDGGGYSKALAKDYWSLWQAASCDQSIDTAIAAQAKQGE